MKEPREKFRLDVTDTNAKCPIGEKVAARTIKERKTPVLSCEGACIRGEIARLAANFVAKEDGFARTCHGELLAAPKSAIRRWAQEAEEVVLIDGCSMRCHGRILENLLGEEKVRCFDALAVHGKYCDRFESDSVPEAERRAVAREVADAVLAELAADAAETEAPAAEKACCQNEN